MNLKYFKDKLISGHYPVEFIVEDVIDCLEKLQTRIEVLEKENETRVRGRFYYADEKGNERSEPFPYKLEGL